MANLLSNKTYPFFEANQLLTAENLNDSFNYLEAQARLSRVAMTGQGILCGLEVTRNDDGKLNISVGMGVTSDGYLLIEEKGKEFSHYKEIDSKAFFESIGGRFYWDEKNEDNDKYTLCELTSDPSDEAISTDDTICKEGEQTSVIVWADLSSDDLNAANKRCIDNINGVTSKSIKLKYFLLKEQVGEEDGNGNTGGEGRTSPIPIRLKRFGLSGGEGVVSIQNVSTYELYHNNYSSLCGTNLGLITSVFNNASSLTKKLPLWETAHFKNWNGQVSSYLIDLSRSVPDLQYVYDYLNDVALAFNEYFEVACEFNTTSSDCLDALNEHCRFITLDIICEQENAKSASRHHFKVRKHLLDRLGQGAELQALYQRLVSLVNREMTLPFSVPIRFVDQAGEEKNAIEITPSKGRTQALEERAIPYYYSARTERYFQQLWKLNQKCRPLPYSYNSSKLCFNIENKEFFRIEGHVGYDLKKVEDTINGYRQQYNLAFDLVVVELDRPDGSNRADCYFQDLEMIYATLMEQWICEVCDLVKCLYMERIRTNQFTILERTIPATPEKIKLIPYCNTDFKYDYIRNDEETQTPIAYTIGLLYEITPLNVSLENDDIWKISDRKEEADTFSKAITLFNNVAEVYEKIIDDKGIRKSFSNFAEEELKDKRGFKQCCEAIKETARNLKNELYKIFQEERATQFKFRVEDLIDKVEVILTNCIKPQLQALLNAYEARKATIQSDLLLSSFAQKHTGLEHLGGVPNGGTFVLVATNASRIVEYFKGYPTARQRDLIVIGDFALPYTCCSDCPPSAVVTIDNTPVFTIKKDTFCLDDEACEFITSPSGGTILVNTNDENFRATVESAIERKETEGEVTYLFHPSKLGDDFDTNRNIILYYIAGGGLTELCLTILPALSASFREVSRNHIFDNNCDLIEIQFVFENLSDSENEYDGTYLWSVTEKGETTILEQEEKTNKSNFVYNHSIKNENSINEITVNLRLQGNNEFCGTTINQDFTVIRSEDLEVIILGEQPFCKDEESIDIFLQPACRGGAFNFLEGEGVIRKDIEPGDERPDCGQIDYLLSTQQVGTLRLEYQLNGEKNENIEIQIEEPVTLQFAEKDRNYKYNQENDCQLQVEFIFENQSSDLSKEFDWLVNGVVVESEPLQAGDAATDFRYTHPFTEESSFGVELTLRNGNCVIPAEPLAVEELIQVDRLSFTGEINDVLCGNEALTLQPSIIGGILALADVEESSNLFQAINADSCAETTYRFDPRNLPNGQYTITYTLGGHTITKDIAIIKPSFSIQRVVLNSDNNSFTIQIVDIEPVSSDEKYNWEIKTSNGSTIFSGESEADDHQNSTYDLEVPYIPTDFGSVSLQLTLSPCEAPFVQSFDYPFEPEFSPENIANPEDEGGLDTNFDALLNQRRVQYDGRLTALATEDQSLAKLKTFEKVSSTIKDVNADTKKFDETSNALMGLIKKGGKRKAQYIEMEKVMLYSFLDKKVFADQENIDDKTRAALKMVVSDLKEVELKPADIFKEWRGTALKAKAVSKYKRIFK